jgi:hypothetical protein
MSNSKVFYTAKEAQERLGLDRNRFNYLIKAGRISRVILPGKKIGVYPVVEVEKFATLLDTTINLYDPNSVSFEIAQESDLEDVVEIGLTVFQGVTTPIEIQKAWLKRCPEAIHVLRSGNREIVGHFIILPIPEERALQVVSRKIIVGNIPLDEIGDFSPGETIHAYVRQIAVLSTNNKSVEANWGMALLTGAANFIEELGIRKVKLGNIYALATTRDGRKACQALGFDRMPIIPDPSKPNEIAFRLDMQESKIIFARNYRENYEHTVKEDYVRVQPEVKRPQGKASQARIA